MKVLLAVEGSKYSQAALDKCCEIFSEAKEVSLKVISVAQPAIFAAEPLAVSAEYIHELDAAAKKNANAVVEHAAARLAEAIPAAGGTVATKVAIGPPEQEILDEAENWGADLIVTGSHGHGFWKRAWLGSVSNAIVNHAPCSVLIVRKSDD